MLTHVRVQKEHMKFLVRETQDMVVYKMYHVQTDMFGVGYTVNVFVKKMYHVLLGMSGVH